MITNKRDIILRNGSQADVQFLYEMLFEAIHWGSGGDRPSMQTFFENVEFQRLLANWGRTGDVSVIAELDSEKIGAAWYRFWTDDNHTYGFVARHIPELGIAVRSDSRSQGIGRLLLRRLKEIAKAERVKELSLSVAPDNFALRLYESEAFTKCGESGTSWTMICTL